MTLYRCPFCGLEVEAIGGDVRHLCTKNRDSRNHPKETVLEPQPSG